MPGSVLNFSRPTPWKTWQNDSDLITLAQPQKAQTSKYKGVIDTEIMKAHIYRPKQPYSSSCDLVLRVDRCLDLPPFRCRDFEAGAADGFFVTLRTF
jgi:hypothetical protein